MTLLRTILALSFSGVLAYICYQLLTKIDISNANQGKRRMASVFVTESRFNRYGDTIVRLFGWEEVGFLQRLQRQLKWVTLIEGHSSYSPAGLLAYAVFLGMAGVLLVAALGDPMLFPLPIFMAYLPFNKMNRKVRMWKRHIAEQLGDFTRNVAARMSTGTPLLTAVEQFSEEPGELPRVLRAEMGALMSQHQNIFTFNDERGRHQGYLASSIRRWGLPELNRFAKKMDQISMTGVNQIEVLYTEANSFSRHYQRMIGKATEKLRIDIIFPLAIFFFIPLLMAAFVPLLLSISL